MKRIAVVAATGAVFVVAYMLEWHVVLPVRRANGMTLASDLAVWIALVAWLLMASLAVGLAWLLFVWDAGDRVAAGAVAVIGLVVWAAFPLAIGPSTASFLSFVPNDVLHAFTGPVGYVPVTAAFVLVVGVAALVRALR